MKVKSAALKYIKKLPKPDRQRIDVAVLSLAEDPHPHGSERLTNGVAQWRVRVGDWRILYDVYEDVLVVDVVRVGARGGVYK